MKIDNLKEIIKRIDPTRLKHLDVYRDKITEVLGFEATCIEVEENQEYFKGTIYDLAYRWEHKTIEILLKGNFTPCDVNNYTLKITQRQQKYCTSFIIFAAMETLEEVFFDIVFKHYSAIKG